MRDAEIVPDKVIVPVLNILEALLFEAPLFLRQCGISVDEMGIDESTCYEPKDDRIYGDEKNVTVITVRGLLSSWKQVIYFTFDSNITKQLLDNIIMKLHKIGANVRCLTTDMGPKNQRLWKELGVGTVRNGVVQSSSFENLESKLKIRVFPDLPHLVKLFRNHVLDDSITFEDGTVLNRDLFMELLRKQKCEFKLTHELSHKHVFVRGKQRQEVRPAFQLLSNRVAEAIIFTNPGNIGRHKQAMKIKQFNDFCDLSNTRVKTPGPSLFKSPYGMFLEDQDALLDNCFQEFSAMRVGKRKNKTLAPFQKGLLMYIYSLRGLLQDMQVAPLSVTYIMTSKVNQDLLENAFSRIRGFGQFSSNPTALECIYRVRKLILSWNFSDSKHTPVEPEEDDYDNIHPIFSKKNEDSEPQESIPVPFSDDILVKLSAIDNVVTPIVLKEADYGVEGRCEEGGMEYVAGYIAKKFKEEHPEFNIMSSNEESNAFWISRISNGNLTEPSVYWFSLFKKLEEFFDAVHPYGRVNKCRSVCKNLQAAIQAKFPDIPANVLKFYVRTRTYIRIKSVNKKREDESFKRQAFRQLIMPIPKDSIASYEDQDEEEKLVLSESGENVLCNLEELFHLN